MVHASLFSGIGGPEVAAAMMGWENAFHCEINPFGRAVLEYWFPNSVSYEDITKTDFSQWRGRIDVLTGGFPCQPFSYAGKRGGREDERYLWPQMLRVIDEIRPAWVVGENVAGLATMVEGGILSDMGSAAALFEEGNELRGYEFEQTFTIERICQDLERIGYSVQPVLIPAAAVGAPHRRDRIFILAHVADADNHPAERVPGEHDGESGAQGLQERHDVQFAGEPTHVRRAAKRTTTDTLRKDLQRRNDAAERGQREIENGSAGFIGCFGDAADTDLQRRNEHDAAALAGQESGLHRKTNIDWRNQEQLRPENRWRNFPTVSPIHRGNDGLPFPLDDLTISQTRWRTEALKAYGNAIVPQVMYEIFRAIGAVSK